MRTFFYWLFSKTKLGRLIDGHKREIGFALWLLGWLIQGAAQAAGIYPDVPVFMTLHEYLLALEQSVGELLRDVGITTLIIGVGSDAIKQNVERPDE